MAHDNYVASAFEQNEVENHNVHIERVSRLDNDHDEHSVSILIYTYFEWSEYLFTTYDIF